MLERMMDTVSARVVRHTEGFMETKMGQWFVGLALIGPLIFLPTVWTAWTAENIDSLRTITWPGMVLVNVAVFISVCHRGDWQIRLSMAMWVTLTTLVSIAIFVR